MTKVLRMYLVAVVWGLVSVGVTLMSVSAHRIGVSAVWQIILDVITAAIIFMAGRAAKQQGAKPVGVGVITGLLFGLVSGWAGFLVHVSRSAIVKGLHGLHLSPAQMNLEVHVANSAAAHLGSWVAVLVVSVIMGLIFGAIGGATAKSPSATQDV